MYTKADFNLNIRIPKGEDISVQYFNRNGDLVNLVTWNRLNERFSLYSVEGGTIRKLGSDQSPIELDVKFKVRERMGMDE